MRRKRGLLPSDEDNAANHGNDDDVLDGEAINGWRRASGGGVIRVGLCRCCCW